jgi:hypothetical protein
MPKGKFTAKDRATLADLRSRYSIAEIEREMQLLPRPKRGGGRKEYSLDERLGNVVTAWSLIERKRDGTGLTASSAAKLALKDAAKVLGRNVSKSWLEKAHRKVERWGQGGTDADRAFFREFMLAAARGRK